MVYYSNTIREKKRHLGLRVLTFFFFFLGGCGCRIYYRIIGVTSFLENKLASLTSRASLSFSKALNLKHVVLLVLDQMSF